jgi:hypothetical protein
MLPIEADLMRVGKLLWESTYRHGTPDILAARIISGKHTAIVERLARFTYEHGSPEAQAELGILKALFLARWAHDGFPRVIAGSHKYAASLMCTRITEDVVEDIPIPWKAFMVVVPQGLLQHGANNYDRIYWHTIEAEDGSTSITIDIDSSDGQAPILCHRAVGTSVKETLFLDPFAQKSNLVFTDCEGNDHCGDELAATWEKKIHLLSSRLVFGLLCGMAYGTRFTSKETNAKHVGTSREAPKHRVVVVGGPIDVDCRPAIHQYMATHQKHSAPSVQTLVRGHYKRQVVGMLRSGRRIVWIQPYWRGPEDAPIMTHGYRLGAAAKERHYGNTR